MMHDDASILVTAMNGPRQLVGVPDLSFRLNGVNVQVGDRYGMDDC